MKQTEVPNIDLRDITVIGPRETLNLIQAGKVPEALVSEMRKFPNAVLGMTRAGQYCLLDIGPRRHTKSEAEAEAIRKQFAALRKVHAKYYFSSLYSEMPPPREPLKNAMKLLDLVPSRGLRKKLRKMVADDQHDIIELHKQGRHGAARFRECTAWVWGVAYVVRHPLAVLVLSLIKKFSAGG